MMSNSDGQKEQTTNHATFLCKSKKFHVNSTRWERAEVDRGMV